MYKILQINVENPLVGIAMFYKNDGKTYNYFDAVKAYNNGDYIHVANIDAKNEQDCFYISNFQDEEKIERILPMHSLTVGDVVIDDYNNVFICAMFGFDPLNVTTQ